MVFSTYAATYPILKYVFTDTSSGGLSIDGTCPSMPNGSLGCRTIVVPNVKGTYSFRFVIHFTLNGNQNFILDRTILVC